MKRIIILLAIFSAVLLFAQFGFLQEIAESEKLQFDSDAGMFCRGDSIYITFIQDGLIFFGISFNGYESFTLSEVDTGEYDRYDYQNPPQIVVREDNTILIFIKQSNQIICHKSEDFGLTFTKEYLGSTSQIKIYQNDGRIFLLNKNSTYRNSAFYEENLDSNYWFGQNETPNIIESYNKINNDYLSQWNSLDKEVETTNKNRDFTSIIEAADEYGIKPVSEEADIAYIKLEGNYYTGFEGVNELVGYDTLNVYSWYPANADQVLTAIDNGINWFEESLIISQNIIPIYQTNWVEISGDIPDGAIMYVPCELWVMGQVQGRQNWVCAEKIRILDDITMAHTTANENPDGAIMDESGFLEYQRPTNRADLLYIFSINRIEIAYKHRDPITGQVINNNSHSDGGIDIFARMHVGIGDMNDFSKGMFTFEYQHPHGSTPDFIGISPYTGNDTLYTKVDLHKFVMGSVELLPPTSVGFAMHGNNPINNLACGYPYESEEYLASIPNSDPANYVYPYGTDYPWYNPVWPESLEDVVFERGDLRFGGSLAQVRRGFIHRSGSDWFNHQNNIWDLEENLYDGVHHSTGYDWGSPSISDVRASFYYKNLIVGNFGNVLEDIEYNLYELNDENDFNHIYTFSLNTPQGVYRFCPLVSSCSANTIWSFYKEYALTIFYTIDNSNNIQQMEIEDFLYQSIDLKCHEESAYLLSYSYENSSDSFTLYIHELDFENSDFLEIYSQQIPYQQEITATLELDSNGKPILAYFIENEGIIFKYDFLNDDFGGEYLWEADFSDMPNRMLLMQSELGIFKAMFSDGIFYGISKLQFAEGEIDLTNGKEVQIQKPVGTLSNHPNPFNPTTEISFTAKDAKNAKIEVYNIKGQKVKSIVVTLSSAKQCIEGSVIWNGTDNNNHPVASGIYYYTLKLDGRTTLSRKMVLLK